MELLAISCKSIHPSLAAHNSPNSWVFSSFCILFFSPSLPTPPPHPPQVTGDPNRSAQQEEVAKQSRAAEHGHTTTLQWIPLQNRDIFTLSPAPNPPKPLTTRAPTHPTTQPPKDSQCCRHSGTGCE